MDRQKRRAQLLSTPELAVYTCHPSMFSATDTLPGPEQFRAKVDKAHTADKVSKQAFVVPSPELVTADYSDDDFVEVLFTPYAHCMYGESLTCPP